MQIAYTCKQKIIRSFEKLKPGRNKQVYIALLTVSMLFTIYRIGTKLSLLIVPITLRIETNKLLIRDSVILKQDQAYNITSSSSVVAELPG